MKLVLDENVLDESGIGMKVVLEALVFYLCSTRGNWENNVWLHQTNLRRAIINSRIEKKDSQGCATNART